MDIIPVGTIPPNPTELLFDERLKQVIALSLIHIYAHPEDDFFLRCGEEAKFLSEDDLNGCERLVRDILRFVRQKFSYEEYRMFMLRFYEAQFSFKALAECMGISASAISQKVCRIVDAVRTHSGFAWRSQMLAVESFMY